jgi:hypothetical protein
MRQWRPALGIPFMRYDLANGSNASRRHSQFLPGRRGITRRRKDLGKLLCAAEKTTCAVCLDLG